MPNSGATIQGLPDARRRVPVNHSQQTSRVAVRLQLKKARLKRACSWLLVVGVMAAIIAGVWVDPEPWMWLPAIALPIILFAGIVMILSARRSISAAKKALRRRPPRAK